MTSAPTADALKALFDAIRAAAPSAEWSTGVSLARDGKVLVEAEASDEVTLRVLLGSRIRSPEVILYPEDADWQCDCGTRVRACAHVAAGVLALRQGTTPDAPVTASASPATPPSGRPPATPSPAPARRRELAHARLGYRFTTSGDLLCFARSLQRIDPDGKPQREVPFRDSVATFRDPDVSLLTGAIDLEIERIVGTWREGRVPTAEIPRLLAALDGHAGVTLDSRPVSVSGKAVLPLLRVEDAGRNYLAELIADPGIRVRFRNGAALMAAAPEGTAPRPGRTAGPQPENGPLTLRPVDDEAGLEQGLRRELARGKAFDATTVPQLVELLARLEKRLPVDVRTRRLPKFSDSAPRLLVRADADGGTLAVLATLVYGDPPFARIDRGRLIQLGDTNELPVRDSAAERRLEQRLMSTLGLEPGRKSLFTGMDAVTFAARLRAFEAGDASDEANPTARGGLTLEGDGARRFALVAPVEGRLSLADDGSVDLSFASGDREADPRAVLEAWRSGWGLAPVGDDGWAPLPADWLSRFGPALLGLLDAKALDGDPKPAPTSALADMVALADALEAPLPPRFDRLRGLVDAFTELPQRALPDGVTATLRPYQQAGYDWLDFHREAGMGALLADDMGLGKTLQALVAARGRTLVVAPTSVMPNWVREASRFRPNLAVATYHGPDRALDAAADLTVTTWAILRLDADFLGTVAWDTVILDESQTMKNPESQVAQAAWRLKAGFRLALTGTPLENRLEDLWSQMRFVEPGLLGDLRSFKSHFAEPIAAGDPVMAARLRARVKPFILRRLKREVAPDLPPRTELVGRVELSAAERELYEALRAATRREVMEALAGGRVNTIQALEALLRLRQAACHPGLIPGQEAPATSAKLEQLLELLETLVAEGHKSLVFSQWTSLLDLVGPRLRRAGLDFVRLDGSTPDRQAVVDRFQADDGPPVMLLSLKAGGTGLNLTAADNVILLDPWWNPAVEDQAADRAHRIGQDRPVMVHRLVAVDTVEERILALQERKRALAESAVGAGGGAAATLTREDLLELLA
jgi:superfamily II DNA or RNA helicase